MIPASGIILGTASTGDLADATSKRFHTSESVEPLLTEFCQRGYSTIDIARAYPVSVPGSSEGVLGHGNLD